MIIKVILRNVRCNKDDIFILLITEENLRKTFNSVHFTLLRGKGKVKAVPLQVWTGLEGSRKFRLPDFVTTAQDGGKFVSLMHRQPLPPGNTPGTHFF